MATDFFNAGKLEQRTQTGAQRQRDIIGGARKEVAPLGGQFKSSIGTAVNTAEQRRRALAGDFLSNLGKGQKALGTAQFGQAKQQILGALPELQRAAREGSAATGGLKRGAAATAIQAPVTQAGAALGDVAGDIAIQAQTQKNQAFSNIFQGDRAFELQKLGIDQDVAETLLSTGRSDILQEALQLAGVEGQLTADLLGIEQNRQEIAAAESLARKQREAALRSAIIGTGGSIIGSVAGRA